MGAAEGHPDDEGADDDAGAYGGRMVEADEGPAGGLLGQVEHEHEVAADLGQQPAADEQDEARRGHLVRDRARVREGSGSGKG